MTSNQLNDSSSETELKSTVASLTKLVSMQSKQLQSLIKLVETKSAASELEAKADIMESLSNRIPLYTHKPMGDSTFEAWYALNEDILEDEAKVLSDSSRARLLRHRLDPVAHERFANFILPILPKDMDYKDTLANLKKIFKRQESDFCLRWKCLQLAKKETEDFNAYTARINKACEEFRLKTMSADEFKCLIFILGLKGPKEADIRARLHNKLDTTDDPKKMTLIALSEEAMRLLKLKHDTKLGSLGESAPVLAVKQHHRGTPRTGQSSSNHHEKKVEKKSNESPRYPCWRCGAMHFTKDCSFLSHTCSRCSKVGHKEGYCNVGANGKGKGAVPKASVVKLPGEPLSNADSWWSNHLHASNRSEDNNNSSSPQSADSLNVNKLSQFGSRKYVDVKINGRLISLQLDTAADVTIITESDWEVLGCPPLKSAACTPVDVNNNRLRIRGVLAVQIELLGMTRVGECYVTTTDTNLFGAPWFTLFDLWDVAPNVYCRKITQKPESFDVERVVGELRSEFSNVFSPTLGHCTMPNVQLHIKPGSVAVFRPKRQVPFRAKERVEEELERLQMAGIITPVDHSEFAAPIVIVQKPNGGVRICADYSTGLNDALLPHNYPIPTPDSIFSNLANCSVFSQVDLSDAYLQIPVDDEARKMLCIHTHRGLFAFNRLCPGVKPAAGLFQQTMDKIFVGMERVSVYFDDILIATADWTEHLEVVREVFMRLTKFNIRARWEKCKFFQTRIKFLGIIVDGDGLRPDMAKIDALVTMPPPTNASQLHSFLGAIGFYMKFVKSMSELRAPLDQLMKKNTEFVWTPECQEAFEKFKEILQSELLLIHYDPELPITIASDASQYGIGAVAYHTLPDSTVKAFYHTSRRLTLAEQKYAQIEKEGLGIVFAVTKLHKYIWGRRFSIQTDARPLLTIYSPTKGIPQHTANRLQRWGLILMAYDFDISYVRTEDFGHADVLSRLIADRPQEDFVIAAITEEEALVVNFVESCDQDIPVKFAELGIATDADADLQQVKDFITQGWPSSTKAIKSGEVLKYFQRRNSLSVINGVIIFRDRTIIPPPLRLRVLRHLHASHPGMTRMKSLARAYVYWPGIDQDIMDLVSQCQPCMEMAKQPVKTDLASWPIPSGPWERVHADYMGPLKDRMYLVVIDAFSKWPEVFVGTSTTAEETVEKISECCARFGAMSTLVTDNGPQFVSSYFEEFCSLNNIKHLTSPAYHPQSNGQAESFVGHLKRNLFKDDNSTPFFLHKFLQSYRATRGPHTPTGQSPAELMFGRRLRLPLDAVLPPKEHRGVRNSQMEEQYNRQHGTVEKFFEEGERVTVRQSPKNKWTKGTVIERIGSVMYNVAVLGGQRLLRAHANQMRANEWRLPADDDPAPAATESAAPPRRNPRAVTRDSPPVLRPRVPRT